jgi:hypothetical protein
MKAFPNMTNHQGMDLRDYFAAKAMQAVVITAKAAEIGTDKGVITEDTHRVARCAYAIADAMMKAREST